MGWQPGGVRGGYKTYKVAVYVIPAPLDLPAAAYNDGAKDKIALWFTDKPGHFDWLRPVKGNELPEEVRTIATDTQPDNFPRGGGGGREADAQSEATMFTCFGGAGGRQLADTHSEATVFTSKMIANVGKASTGTLAAPAVEDHGGGDRDLASSKGGVVASLHGSGVANI